MALDGEKPTRSPMKRREAGLVLTNSLNSEIGRAGKRPWAREPVMRWANWVVRSVRSSVRPLRRRSLLGVQSLENRDVQSVVEPGIIPTPTPQPPLPQASGQLWRDLNANGLRDAGEPGIPFVTLQLFQGDTQVGTTSTDFLGNYRFNSWNVNNGTADTNDDGLK